LPGEGGSLSFGGRGSLCSGRRGQFNLAKGGHFGVFYPGTAPLGYKNLSTPDGRKYIAPYEPEAGIMKWVFQEIAKNVFAVDQIRKKANQLGLICTRMTFWRNVRNPVYCGKLVIKQHKDEEAYIVDAQHEPLVSQALFYDVQDILNGRKRIPAAKLLSMELLPLRNFLKCNKCHRMLTGSSSKGKTRHYYYYHCDYTCGVRYNCYPPFFRTGLLSENSN